MRIPTCVAFVALALFVTAPVLRAQNVPPTAKKNAKKAAANSKPNKPADSETKSKSSNALASAALQAASGNQSPGADYVPCKFTLGELESLSAPDQKKVLSPSDAEQFVASVAQETFNQQSSKLLDEATAQILVESLNPDSFVGLTPSQATAAVMRTLSVVRDAARVQNDLAAAQGAIQSTGQTPTAIDDLKRKLKGWDLDAQSAYKDEGAALGSLPASQELRDAVATAHERALAVDDLAKLSDDQLAELGAIGNSTKYAGKSSDQIVTLSNRYNESYFYPSTESSSPSAKPSSTAIPDSTKDGAKSKPSAAGSNPEKESPVTGNAELVSIAASNIVSRARTSLELLMRPEDVGCAMSVLSAMETSRAYGELVAKRYIAVQVVVRNVNRDREFVLHDAELAVNIDPTGLPGRFYSGRDKVIVRQTANRQQYFDTRNIFVHTAEGLGAIMSAAAIVYGGALADAANVFQSAFYQSLSKSWRDMSVDELNLLNDTGFTSQSSSQIVVPKTGTVMFVMFVPSKQFEQGWWVQPCATRNFFGTVADPDHREMIGLTEKDKAAGAEPVAATGIDVQRAIAGCKLDKGRRNQWTYNPFPTLKKHSTGTVPVEQGFIDDGQGKDTAKGGASTDASGPGKVAGSSAGDTSTANVGASSGASGPAQPASKPTNSAWWLQATPVPYSKWSGNSLAIFQELSTAVVAGMHVLDESALAVQLTEMKCDTDASIGTLKFPVPDHGELQCSLTGKNLDKAAQIRLRNMKDATDAVTADGRVQVSGGDNTKATVTFSTDALRKLPGTDYAAYIVDKNGNESKNDAVVHFNNARVIESVDPASIDLDAVPALIKLNGAHLAPESVKALTIKTSLAAVSLSKNSGSNDTTLAFDTQSKTEDWAKLAKAGTTVKAALTLDLTDGTEKELSNLAEVKITGASKTTAQRSPPAVNKPKKSRPPKNH